MLENISTTCVDVLSLEYIHLIPKRGEMYIRGTKIRLTPFECIFISYLIINNGYCNIKDFGKQKLKRKSPLMRRENVVVGVNRLRKKIQYQTGLNIIKTRYGYGYYLNI